MSENGAYDVAIVGGGPAGCTVATLLLKYNPKLRVLILEKERFPRDHIGESQLPVCAHVCAEMGCWDKIEAANFPVKIGATFQWGRHADTWDFDFYPVEMLKDEPRPGKFEGQRRFTAFQVDRAIYDKILLDHAREMGVEVREETKVEEVLKDGDRIEGFRLSDGSTVRATHYVDASGAVGLVRRAMGVESTQPHELRNIAIWDYWENAEWAVKIGVGGTRIQVRSLPYGWLWFIPLGPTRTSIGLVCPSAHYQEMGISAAELYHRAIEEQGEIAGLCAKATPSGDVQTTKDWSHLSSRLAGENWFLCGEAAGFADPILSAGMSLAHGSGREVAYTILELERGDHDAAWLKTQYDERNRKSIWQHIRFALYWYSANDRFTDLKSHCSKIASEAGLELSPQQAWRWLAQGGFVNTGRAGPAAGSFDLACAKGLIEWFHGEECGYAFDTHNVFRLNLDGADETSFPEFKEGRILRQKCLNRDGRVLPISGSYQTLIQTLKQKNDIASILGVWREMAERRLTPEERGPMITLLLTTLDAMVAEGWVTAASDPSRPHYERSRAPTPNLRSSRAGIEALERRKTSQGNGA